MKVNYENDPESAMITFSNPAEANAAIKSTEAVLNNRWVPLINSVICLYNGTNYLNEFFRFIKVFWHNSNKEGGKHNQKDKFGSGNTNPTGTANNVPGDGNNVSYTNFKIQNGCLTNVPFNMYYFCFKYFQFSMGTTKKPAGDGATKSEFSLSPEEKKAKVSSLDFKKKEFLHKGNESKMFFWNFSDISGHKKVSRDVREKPIVEKEDGRKKKRSVEADE